MVVRHQGRLMRDDSLIGSSAVTHRTDGGRRLPPEAAASLVVHTPAKLNLVLNVLGRRDDGYHDIETVMVSLGLYDTLICRKDVSGPIRMVCRDGGSSSGLKPNGERPISSGADNLVVRAAELVRQRTGTRQCVVIELIKRIPVQAGLGGGSSDAAATLVALNQLWDLKLPSADLHGLAAELGSDVNFFLDSPLAAVCRGRGERVESIPLPRRLHVVVVAPPTGLSTADVFREWSQSSPRHRNAAEQIGSEFINSHWIQKRATQDRGLCNDLEAPARRLNADVDATLTQLRRISRGPVGMSGSGSACFALCPTSTHAHKLAGQARGVLAGRIFALASRT